MLIDAPNPSTHTLPDRKKKRSPFSDGKDQPADQQEEGNSGTRIVVRSQANSLLAGEMVLYLHQNSEEAEPKAMKQLHRIAAFENYRQTVRRVSAEDNAEANTFDDIDVVPKKLLEFS